MVVLCYTALPEVDRNHPKPTWTGKTTATFSDAITLVYRDLWRRWIFATHALKRVMQKLTPNPKHAHTGNVMAKVELKQRCSFHRMSTMLRKEIELWRWGQCCAEPTRILHVPCGQKTATPLGQAEGAFLRRPASSAAPPNNHEFSTPKPKGSDSPAASDGVDLVRSAVDSAKPTAAADSRRSSEGTFWASLTSSISNSSSAC